MNKKLKFALIALIALNAIACGWFIYTADIAEAIASGLTALYMSIFFILAKLYFAQLKESSTRERIAKQEFNKMHQRAEDAEKKYKELLDDTPTRDKKGRFAKR